MEKTKKIVSIMSAVLMLISAFTAIPLSVSAETFTSGDYEYKILEDGTAEIAKYNGSDSELNLPSELGDKKVTSVGEDAFRRCLSIKVLKFSNYVTRIGNGTFYDCANLKSVIINDKIKIIDAYTFCNCTRLANIRIPNGVTSIEREAFENCKSLTNITIPNSVTSIKEYAFNKCSSLLNVTIPNSVTNIGRNAFYNCPKIKSVVIPDSVMYIGELAFGYYFHESIMDDYKINNFNVFGINESEAENYAKNNGFQFFESNNISQESSESPSFEFDPDWEYIVLSDGTIQIIEYTGSMSELIIPSTLNGFSVSSVGTNDSSNFELGINKIIPNCVNSIIISEGINKITNEAFAYCKTLTNIYIPSSVTNIGNEAFYYCTGLQRIDVNENNSYYSSIEGNLYNKDKTDLIQYSIGKINTSFTVPNSTNNINEGAFAYCYNLSQISLSNSVVNIGDIAFSNCINLRELIIPNSVKNIGQQAFEDCKNITSIIIPDTVTRIGTYAFGDCDTLKYVSIGNGISNLNEEVFSGCEELTDIIISNSIKSIGFWAFKNCVSLENVYYLGNSEEWNLININDENECLLNARIHFISTITLNDLLYTFLQKRGEKTNSSLQAKKANPITVKVKTKTVKAKKLKKKAQKVKAITVKNAQGKVSYKLVKSGITKKIRKIVKINSKGVITIKKWKKAKKSTYKIEVSITAAGNSQFNSKTLTKTIKVKII